MSKAYEQNYVSYRHEETKIVRCATLAAAAATTVSIYVPQAAMGQWR